jgi:hypothetical protein
MSQPLRSMRPPEPNEFNNIRMSLFDRLPESSGAKTNWSDIAKIMFYNDEDFGRQKEMGKFTSPEETLLVAALNSPEWRKDQLRFVLLLIVIAGIAENRTQEIYEKDFSLRCDRLNQVQALKDDPYSEKGPAEWEQLNEEFERVSNQILVGTLREYHQNQIADLVRIQGSDQIFEIIRSIQADRIVRKNVLREGVAPPESSQFTDPGENL